MKKVFVAVPPKYGLDDDGFRDYERKIEKIAPKVEKILDEHVVICNLKSSFLREKCNTQENAKGFIFNCLYNLCNADLVIFAGDWEHSKECRLLHTIAVGADIPILDINTVTEGINP